MACWNRAHACSSARHCQNRADCSVRGPSPSIASSSDQPNGVCPMMSRL